MVLKLHGLPISTCTRRAIVTLLEKGIPYELIPVNPLAGATQDGSYLDKMQPFAQIPVLEDDGLFIFESRAIARYIATKYATEGTPDLVPSPSSPAYLAELAAFEQACSIEYAQFNAAAEGLIHERLVNKVKGLPTDEKLAEHWADQLATKLDAYERILSKQRYLAGDHVTLADLFHLPFIQVLVSMLHSDFFAPSIRPHLARWWADISSRESWQAIVRAGAEDAAIYEKLRKEKAATVANGVDGTEKVEVQC